jgi:DNA repair exonuclease SbcCD nuclease subunit
MRFRFLHAADLHLDTPFVGIHRVDARLAETLRDATKQAFENLVVAALEHEVAFVVIAGDVYDGPQRGVRAQLAFRDGLERLARAGIRCFVVHGNHDPVDEGWSAVRTWPDGVKVFGSTEVEAVPVEWEGHLLAVVHGVSYATRRVTENLSRRFRRLEVPCLQVGVLHCNAGANADHAAYSPCSVDDLVAAGLDYWALGHVHSRQFLRSGAPWIAYPGNLQGLSPKPTECGAKGALLIDVEDNHVTDVSFLPLDVVRFDEFEVDIASIPDVGSLAETLCDAARERAASHDLRAVVLRAVLVGRGDVHADLRRGRTREQLLGPVRTTLASATPAIWMNAIDDCTRPALDIDEMRGRADFTADLIATADATLVAPPSRSALIEPHLTDLPTGELRRLLEDDIGAAPSEDEIRRALDIALDHVAETEA